MRETDSNPYLILCSPRAWGKLESVPAPTLSRLQHTLRGLAQRLAANGVDPRRLPQTGTLDVDEHIAVYELDPSRRRIILEEILRRPVMTHSE